MDVDGQRSRQSRQRALIANITAAPSSSSIPSIRAEQAAGTLIIAGVAPCDADGLDWLDGMGDDNIEEFGAALNGADELRTFLDQVAAHLRHVDVDGIVEQLSSLLPAVDRAALTGEYAEDLVAHIHEALRTGVDGWLDDDLAFVAPWGFDLNDVSTPLMVWQGSDDLMVPIAHGEWLGAHLPGANVHLEYGQGHLSIAIGSLDRMLDELIETLS